MEVGPPSAQEPAPGTQETFAQRLDYVFRTIHPAGRGPYLNAEVARALTAKAQDKSEAISETYIGYLRTGKRDNPTKKHLERLAEFFGVTVGYLLGEEEGTQNARDLALLDALKGVNAKSVALRTVADLDEAALDALVPVLQHLATIRPRMRMGDADADTSPGVGKS